MKLRSSSLLGVAAILFVICLTSHAPVARAETESQRYLSPGDMAVSPDGRRIYIVAERADELLVLDVKTKTVSNRIAVGHAPRGLALSPDGRRVYVTNSWDDTVSVIDTGSLAALRSLKAGAEPTDVIVTDGGKTLYVANRLSDDISVLDVATGEEIKRLMAGRGASYLALSADGKRVYCTHVYPKISGSRTRPESEITVIDTGKQVVVDRIPLHNVGGVFRMALSADGRVGVAAQLRPKNLIPLAHVEHGSVFGDSLALFGPAIGEPIQIPLDELDRYFAMPYAVAMTSDAAKLYVSTGGSGSITAIDLQKLLRFARSAPKDVGNDLSASANYVTGRIAVGTNPRELLLSPDGRSLYVSNRLDDTLAVISTQTDTVTSTIDLGGRRDFNALRQGERIFYTTKYSFQGAFSCANCHIDATFDGMQWDLEPDGFGKDIVDNRSIEDLSATEPFKWNGGNPNMATECGPRTEKFFYRSQSYSAEELADLVSFVMSIPVRPNRYRLPAGELSSSQERGKVIFNRTTDKNGRPIPKEKQCAYCHSGPKYTNNQLFDVGTGKPTDRSPKIDVPHLPNVAYSAPYLHDGSARSLEEIWTVFNPKDTHGVSNDLTKDELNDLVEYLRTL